MDASGIALLEEDLQSPCTEEVTVFHAFSPHAWVINRSMLAAGTHDLLQAAYPEGKQKQMERMANGRSRNTVVVLWPKSPRVSIRTYLRRW